MQPRAPNRLSTLIASVVLLLGVALIGGRLSGKATGGADEPMGCGAGVPPQGQLRTQAGVDAGVVTEPVQGLSGVAMELSPRVERRLASKVKPVIDHLRTPGERLAAQDLAELTVTSLSEAAAGQSQVRVQQLHLGIPVFGAEAIVHLDAAGEVTATTDALIHELRVEGAPALDGAAAIERANSGLAPCPHCTRPPFGWTTC